MSNFVPTSFLTNQTNITLRDSQTASRLFVSDQFRLAPKQKFLFHVAFSINSAACKDVTLVQRHGTEINMLVKSTDLPNFNLEVETLNQYNRKTNVQYRQKYNAINMIFHDDNMGVINQLWQNYYSYYYADSTSAHTPGAFSRNATKNYGSILAPYGLDTGSQLPFFNYITIYQMARHEWVSYKLINPIITQWNHNKLDYAGTGTHDNNMQLQYEAVAYDTGITTDGSVEGFAQEHYDVTPSPMTGVDIANSSPTFSSPTSRSSLLGYFENASQTVNTYENTQSLTDSGVPGLLDNVASTAVQGVSGLQGISFPIVQQTTATTKATPRG
jgi:hypothetical protein